MVNNRQVKVIVPIKGHSERVPRKNFRSFNGKPLFHHIFLTLGSVEEVDQIIINTDSDEIKNQAPKISSKIKISKRPESLCGDFVSVNLLIEHEVKNMSDTDIIFQTHATNPNLQVSTISKAIQAFNNNLDKHDSLFTVNRFQSRFFTHDGKAINHNPNELIRTQDLNPVYEENSCLYMFTKEAFYLDQKRIGRKPMFFETPFVESLDIDDKKDFLVAEMYNKNLNLFL